MDDIKLQKVEAETQRWFSHTQNRLKEQEISNC